MYNIYYSLADSDWQGYNIESHGDTVIKAFMDAVRAVRKALSTTAIEFLPVGEMEFVIWSQGKCKGFLSVTEQEPVDGG